MHFFKSDKKNGGKPGAGVFAACFSGLSKLTAPVLKNEDRTGAMGFLLFVLVFLVHVLLASGLQSGDTQEIKPKPIIMAVSLLAVPKQIDVAGPVSAPVPKVEKTKPIAPKSPEKPKIQKKQPALPKPMEKAETVKTGAEAEMPAPHFEPFVPMAKEVAQTAKPVPSVVAPKAAKENEPATCVACPEPLFPAIAQRRGWQGSVLLKFQLTPAGLAENITVIRSSGHELLDEAAIDTAKASRFTTASTGEIRNVTRSYKFTLKEE